MTTSRQCLIWVLQTARAGDNAQARELAGRLAGQQVLKPLGFNSWHRLPNGFTRASLVTLDKVTRASLTPPWPDLVIATGKRTVPVALWIRQASGGRVKLIQIGRPRAPLRLFDLVVTTPQYGLPEAANVVHMDLPFTSRRSIDAGEMARWRVVWNDLPRPWIVGVLGAARYPLTMSVRQAGSMGRALSAFARRQGGSVILISSPRTDKTMAQAVAAAVTTPIWTGGPASAEGNPYAAALALGDRFAVTSDSVSMVADLLATEKPVSIYRLPLAPLRLRWPAKTGLAAALVRRGILHPPRDVDALVQGLLDKGVVAELGHEDEPHPFFDQKAAEEAVVARIQAMLECAI
ncbi:MAG TPA: ELM1/GtrOC1 family putative glycosyltransferase [Aestuariivirga sp.]|nr:ELM1/GtrOC1 family putative glycosyltransferase [Aestuariivirga sp.]